jgi:D-alanine transaminase
MLENQIAGAGLKLEQKPIPAADLPRLTELFISGTSTDVMPIVSVDGRPVADGKPGEVTRRLQKVLDDAIYSNAD